MQVHTVFRTGEHSARLTEHAREALVKLERVHDDHAEAHVTFSAEGLERRVDVRVHTRGHDIKCSEANGTYEAALDKCVESIRRSLLRHKEQARTKDPEREVWH